MHAFPVAGQSLGELHWTQPLGVHAGVAPMHWTGVPGTQALEALHVGVGVNTVPVQKAAGQSMPELH